MKYTELTPDDQNEMLRQRLKIYEHQHYDTDMNLRMALATDAGEGMVAGLVKKLTDLETCIGLVAADLVASEIGASTSDTNGDGMTANDGTRPARPTEAGNGNPRG